MKPKPGLPQNVRLSEGLGLNARPLFSEPFPPIRLYSERELIRLDSAETEEVGFFWREFHEEHVANVSRLIGIKPVKVLMFKALDARVLLARGRKVLRSVCKVRRYLQEDIAASQRALFFFVIWKMPVHKMLSSNEKVERGILIVHAASHSAQVVECLAQQVARRLESCEGGERGHLI